MYKTVRKGDASLQYTILPQSDQFNAPGLSQPMINKDRPIVVKCILVLFVIVLILSFVAIPFLINQNGNNLLKSTMLRMSSRVEDLQDNKDNSTRTNKIKNHITDRKTIENLSTQSKILRNKNSNDDYEKISKDPTLIEISGTTSSFKDEKNEDISESEYIANDLKNNLLPASTVTTLSNRFGAGAAGILKTTKNNFEKKTSSLHSTTTTSRSSSLSSTATIENNEESSTDVPKILPRVTLKLRENETIPQMYMKAGIASYKKGNITTSVLAHGLSLEGLIFKTPEGTIKPWPQKWPFADPSSYFQWKGIRQVPRIVYFVILGFAALATTGIILMTYIQWRASSRRQRGNVEVLEIESQEEDESTLLGSEMTTETVEKE